MGVLNLYCFNYYLVNVIAYMLLGYFKGIYSTQNKNAGI